jgi:protein-S-isoprenylcysteine O-methyltransferase Ste14
VQPDATPNLLPYIDAVWVAVGVVWAVAAIRTKRATLAQTRASRLIHIALGAVAFVLLFNPQLAIGPLAWRFVPLSPEVSYTGLALTLAGAAFAIWARATLGRNWSGIVTIKEDHQIIRTGPYALVRHPIYSGFLLAMLGTALAIGQIRGLVGLVIAFGAWWFKSRIEEKFMEQQFGGQYVAYRQQVKAFIPFVL